MSTPTPAPAPYDVNFFFPVCELENDRVKLTPFIPAQHADLFIQGASSHPELFQYLPFGPYSSPSAFTKQFVDTRVQPDPSSLLYAIIDKTKTKTKTKTNPSPSPSPSPTAQDFAGTIGFLNGSLENLSVEIGYLIILPPFQRTHVTTNAVGLLLRYALDLQTATPPGLGLRRVQWQASERNDASVRAAERMGLKREARLRWDRVLAGGAGKVDNGQDIREGDPKPGTLGRHTALLAICWDDWENGWRESVARNMDRYPLSTGHYQGDLMP